MNQLWSVFVTCVWMIRWCESSVFANILIFFKVFGLSICIFSYLLDHRKTLYVFEWNFQNSQNFLLAKSPKSPKNPVFYPIFCTSAVVYQVILLNVARTLGNIFHSATLSKKLPIRSRRNCYNSGQFNSNKPEFEFRSLSETCVHLSSYELHHRFSALSLSACGDTNFLQMNWRNCRNVPWTCCLVVGVGVRQGTEKERSTETVG